MDVRAALKERPAGLHCCNADRGLNAASAHAVGLAPAISNDAAMLGCSMLNIKPHATVPVAMVNDLHFWGLRASIADAPVPVQSQDADVIKLPRPPRKRKAAAGAEPDGADESHAELLPWRRGLIAPERPPPHAKR